MHKFLRRRVAVGAAMVMSIGAVAVAPIATSQSVTAGSSATGVSSISDEARVDLSPGKGNPRDRNKTVDVHLLAFNDLHGTLDPAGNNIYGKFAGGAAYLAKAVKDRQAAYGRLQATVFAGDNIGASTLANGLFFEEPITIATNLMNVDFASVGNHEFDKGKDELLRIQNGGCRPEGCTAAPYALPNGRTTNVFPGADFQYLSANVIVDETGKTLFPAYGIKEFKGKQGPSFRVGFIGEVLEGTPSIVTPSGVAGLTFQDEADAANRAVRDLARRHVNIPILVIHEGGFQSPGATAPDGCNGNLAGSAIAEIASRLDPAIRVIVSGHTHAEYACTITTNGVTRLITSASSFGRILTDITLTVDPKRGTLVSASADNVIVENALNTPGPGVTRVPDPSKADPGVQAVVDQYLTSSAPLANQVIGSITADLNRTATPQGETTLGDVIADAQLMATAPADHGGAVVAFMNPGGVRNDLRFSDISSGGEAPGQVTYGEAFTVQPFGNSLVTKTMTGAQIRLLLEQQFVGCGGQTVQRILQISSTMTYQQDGSQAACADKIGTISINGVEVQPADSFRVTMNNFLATGGDGFTVFNQGTDALGGDQDIDAFVAYFAANPAGISPPPLTRIVPTT